MQQALQADAVDSLILDVVPIVLGGGERLFDGVPALEFDVVEVLPSPYATHVRYQRRR